jgi:hypothetical protein
MDAAGLVVTGVNVFAFAISLNKNGDAFVASPQVLRLIAHVPATDIAPLFACVTKI